MTTTTTTTTTAAAAIMISLKTDLRFARYKVNSADILESIGWETLEERRKRNKSILMYRILNNYTAPNLKNVFTLNSALQGSYNFRIDLLI
jgi:hypothetical protein